MEVSEGITGLRFTGGNANILGAADDHSQERSR